MSKASDEEILAQARQLERDLATEKAKWREADEPRLWVGVTLAVAAAGFIAFLVYMQGEVVVDYLRARSWVATPAVVVELQLFESSRGSRRTYMRYVYEQDGRACRGGRINIRNDAGMDYFDRYVPAFKARKPITVFVDPGARCRAIADNTFPWFTLFPTSLGIGMAAWAIAFAWRRGWKVAL